MPKAWDENEKLLVRNTLLEKGRRLFDKYGLQKTTVDQIVNAAGISKGAFYLFYTSKEELYFAVLETAENEFRENVYRTLTSPGPSRRESFRQFLQKTMDFLMTSPLYSQLDSGNLQYLMRKLSPELLEQHMKNDREYFEQHLEVWMKNGWMRTVNTQALTGVLLSLVYFVVHREDIGVGEFESSKELLMDMITNYLILEE